MPFISYLFLIYVIHYWWYMIIFWLFLIWEFHAWIYYVLIKSTSHFPSFHSSLSPLPSNFSSHLHVLCLKPAFSILPFLCGAMAPKKIVSLPQQVTFAGSSTVRSATPWTPPTAMLGFWLAGSCYYLVCAVTASESCGQQPSHAGNTALLQTSAASGCPVSLWQWFLRFGGRGCIRDTPFRADCTIPSLFSACWPL